MGFQDDLAVALKTLQSGTEELSQFRAVTQANEAVQRIRAAEGNEAAKRAQFQQIANQLTGTLAAGGTPATTIQEIAKAFGPPKADTVGAALEAKASAASPQDAAFYQEQAENIDVTSTAGESKLQKQQQEFQAKENALDRASKEALAGQKGMRPLRPDMINKLTSFDEENIRGEDLLNRLEENKNLTGPAAGRIPGREIVDPDYAAFKADVGQWFDVYRVRVTGAGASPGELKILNKNRPQITDTPEVFKKKTATLLELGKKVKQRTLENWGKAKFDISNFQDDGSAPKEAAASPAAPSRKPVTYIDPVTKKSTKGFTDGSIIYDDKGVAKARLPKGQ